MSQHRRTQKPQLQRRQQELAFPSPLCSTPAHKVLGDASPPGDGGVVVTDSEAALFQKHPEMTLPAL